MTHTQASWRVEWRPKAREDLHVVIRNVGKQDPGRAEVFGQILRDRIGSLAQHPEMGRAGRPGLPDDVREWLIDAGYLAFYRMQAQARTIEILRLKHAAHHAP